MKIAIFGYGKMGKEIEKILHQRGHEVVEKITSKSDKSLINTAHIDVVIDFSSPHAAYENIQFCIDHQLPVVIGSVIEPTLRTSLRLMFSFLVSRPL